MSTMTETQTRSCSHSQAGEELLISHATVVALKQQTYQNLDYSTRESPIFKPSPTSSSSGSTAALSSQPSLNQFSGMQVVDSLDNEASEVEGPTEERHPPQRTISNLSFRDCYADSQELEKDVPSIQHGILPSEKEPLLPEAESEQALVAQTSNEGHHSGSPPESLTNPVKPSTAIIVSPAVLPPSSAQPNFIDVMKLLIPPPPTGGKFPATTCVPMKVANTSAPFSPSTSQLSTGSVSSSVGSGPPRPPVLYSAIGSLEDPTSSYQKNWNQQRRIPKFEFPSNLLLVPPSQVLQQSNVITGTSQSQQFLFPLQPTKPRSPVKGDEPQVKQSSLSAKLTALEVVENSTPTDNATEEPKTSNLISTVGKPSKEVDAMKGTSSTDAAVVDGEKRSDISTKVAPVRSSLRTSRVDRAASTKPRSSLPDAKKVTISVQKNLVSSVGRSKKKKKGPVEMFRPSSDAYTPRMGKKNLKYKPAEMRTPVQKMASPMGTLSRPNFRDALRRVAMIIHQHVVKIERRFEKKNLVRGDDGLFLKSMRDTFSEECFATPKYKCAMVRVPMARPGMVFGLKMVRHHYGIPTEAEIYEFAHRLFNTVQLSSECSIVCLIYVERLMEQAKVPLLACTWRPIFMCGLLLASKVWQDLSSWNIEFASVYPQFSLESINRLELQFLRMVKWDLYISSSLYAKYYFALRSVVEKPDFRNRYNRMVAGVNNVQASEARKVEERSKEVKEEALLQLSRSM